MGAYNRAPGRPVCVKDRRSSSRTTGVRAKSASPANSGRVVKRRVRMTARLIVSPQDLKHGSDHKFSGPRRERAVDHLGVKTTQILADERLGDYTVAEFGEEPIDSGLSL
jgi:hypothetical protein